MKIKRGDIYYIDLYLEPGKISDHNKRSNGTLSFTGVELMDRCDLHRFWIDWELFYEIWNEICV